MTSTSSSLDALDARTRREYRRLCKQLENLPLLAQGSVFAIDPPEAAPRASRRYAWTRKVKAKTVTRGLTAEEYRQLKAAIDENRKVEAILKRLREISQDALVASKRKSPEKRGRKPS
jgi:hypothetical protein